jgi:hypothetical protein
MTSASVLLTMAAFVLGIICRFNFGKGLPRYRELIPSGCFRRVDEMPMSS